MRTYWLPGEGGPSDLGGGERERERERESHDLWPLPCESALGLVAACGLDLPSLVACRDCRYQAPALYPRVAYAGLSGRGLPTAGRGLAHREELTTCFLHVDTEQRQQYIVRTLGQVGTTSTAVLLRSDVADPALGGEAVTAIRQIEQRDGIPG
jgi:hypothetical protein